MLNIPMLRMKTLLDLARNSGEEAITPPELKFDMQNKFQRQLDTYPERQEPSGWRKFGAAIYGMGSENPAEATDTFLNFHRLQRLQDWKQKTPFIQQAADNERQLDLGLLADYNRKMSDRNAKRRIDETARHNKETEEISFGKLEDQRQRTLLQQNKQNYQYFIDNDGMVVGVNRANPSDVRETHIHSNKLSDADKLDLQLGNAKELEAIRQKNRMVLEGERTKNDITVKQTPSASASGAGKPLTNAQLTARAKDAISAHPEWKPYIKMSPSGQFLEVVLPPGKKAGWLTPEEKAGDPKVQQQVYEYIFGKQKESSTGKNLDGWVIK